MTKKEQKENIVDDTSITKNFTAILKSFRQWIPGASHQRYDAKDDSTSEEEESAETRRENRRQSYRDRRLRRTKSTRTNNSLRHSRSSKTSKTIEKERTQSRIQPNKQLPAIPKNIVGSTEIPPKRDAIIATTSHPLPRKPLPLDAATKTPGGALTENSKPVIPQETSKSEKSKKSLSKDSVTEKKSIHIVNDIPQEHRTRFAAAFGSIQKLRMPSSEDNVEKSITKPVQNNRERKRSSCEITLSQNNLHKIGQSTTSGNSNVATGSLSIGTEMTHGFSQNDLDEAEKLFKTDSKFASLFQAAEVSTSPSEESEASSDSENSSEAQENPKSSRRGSRLQKMKQSGHRDSGISSNRNEDEELTILPMEVEIIQANRDDERKKNKPRIKANSAGQEPPAVPPKPQYVRTFSMTSVSNASSMESVNHLPRNQIYHTNSNLNKRAHTWSLSSVNSDASDLLSRPFSLPHPNLVQFNQFSISSPDVSLVANQNRPSSEPPSTTNNSLSPPLNPKRGNETGVLKRNNNSSLIKQIHVGKSVGKTQQGLEKSDSMVSVTGASGPNVVDPIKRSVAEDSGIATNNESANEKPSSRKRSAREIAQLYEQLKSKHIQRKREWNQEREMLLMRCKATENSQQVLRNVRGILEQLRAELKREENRRNELEREFLQNKILWDRERKELHEEIYELQRTEQMWLQHGDVPDSRVAVLHKKVQELRNEKLSILKMAEIEKMNWEEQKQQLLIQLRQHGVTFQPNGQINPNGISSELNDRLEGALQQIETVSRQLYSVQDSSKVNFQNGTLIGQQNRQMSASTSCLPEMNQQRPKSSFDLGLQGPIPWQMSNGNTNRTAVGFAGAQPQRPKTGDHLRATPNSYDQTATQSIQQNNLSYQQQQLQIQQQQQQQQAQAAAQQRLAQEREQQRLQRQKQNLEAFQQQMANQGRVRFQQNSTAPLQDTKKSVLIDSPLDRQNDRAFDSDDGAARARRESRLRRMKLLEQRRNVLCGETTDDNEERNEQVQRERTKRSKKYTRSKTDGNAAEMRAAMLSKNNKLDRNGKPKVLEQFERKLLKNENRAPSSERNGVIERRLSGSSHGAAALADGKTPIDQLNSMVSNFKMADQPKPSTTPPSVKVDEQPQASVESLKNQIQQRNNSTAADASPRQTAQTRGRLNAQSYRQFTALGNNATSGTSTNNNIGSNIGQDMGGVPSNLSRGKGLSGSTPNLSESQMNEKYQRGFDTTPAERAAQLRKAREQIEQEKIKRTESLKQRISMFEAARQRSNQTDSPPQATPNNVTRSQSLKMAPTFLNQSKTISATEEADRNQVLDQQRKQNNAVISENFAKNRSMVAGILNAGPPKKKASKYGRALTQPIEAADRTEPIVPVNVPERPSGPANRRLPSRWRSGERKSTTSGYDLDLSVD